VNVSDITPTVYDLLGMTPPGTVKGIPQKPMDGVGNGLQHPLQAVQALRLA
ncbi:hypothetical protein AO39_03745, partial [Mycobacterium tuberculosis M1762]